jgi:hypothetical protein
MKKAGTFFKSVISKGKNFLKKEESKNPENHPDTGFDSEEDQDIIEVGKSANHMMPSSIY